MSTLLSIVSLLLLAAPPAAPDAPVRAEQAPPPAVEIDGFYSVRGEHPSGNTYEGVAMIKETKGQVAIRWFVGGQITNGVGLRDGGHIWFGWTAEGMIGVCRFRVEVEKDRPKLIGDKAANETMTWLRPLKE